MHNSVHHFVENVKEKFPEYFEGKSVLEVGSMDVNGSVRMHFIPSFYVGIDLGEGDGVDVVCSIIEYNAPNTFDVIISCEMLEHCEEWEKALEQMYKNLKEGGILILTCASTNRQPHGTHEHHPGDSKFTLDWYRNISMADFISILPPELFSNYSIGEFDGAIDLRMYGIKLTH